MDGEELNLCVDCKWVTGEYGQLVSSISPENVVFCLSPDVVERSPVNGYPKIERAVWARTPNGKCGPKGKFWTSKS